MQNFLFIFQKKIINTNANIIYTKCARKKLKKKEKK